MKGEGRATPPHKFPSAPNYVAYVIGREGTSLRSMGNSLHGSVVLLQQQPCHKVGIIIPNVVYNRYSALYTTLSFSPLSLTVTFALLIGSRAHIITILTAITL